MFKGRFKVLHMVFVALALALAWGQAAWADTVTLYPTANTTTGTVTNPTNAYSNNDTGALVSSNSSALQVYGFDNTNLGTISDVTVYVKYMTTAAPSNDTYQFDAARDGTNYNDTIVSATTTNVTTYTTQSLSLGALSWAEVGTLRLRCLTSKTGGADGYSVDWDVGYIVVTYTPAAGAVTVGTSGTQVSSLNIPSTNNYVGGQFTFVRDTGSTNVTAIAITETGTVNADTNLANAKLYYDTACDGYQGGESQFGTAQSFSTSKASFTGTMAVGTTTVCVYVVLDVGSGATNGQTLDIEISNPSTEVTVAAGSVTPATPVAISGTTTLQEPTVTVGASGTQVSSLNIPSTNNYVGGWFTFVRSTGSTNVTAITISETGTVNADTNLANAKLYYDTACDGYQGGETQFGSTTSFSASDASFSGAMAVSTTTVCVYVVLDVGSGASSGETLDIEITNPSTEVTVAAGLVSPATPVAISGTTTLQEPTVTVGAAGTQASSMSIPSTNNYVGGRFTFVRSTGSTNVTAIAITETGTVNADTNLANAKLYYDTACDGYQGGESQFGTAQSFSTSKASFTGTMAVSTTTVCVYVVLDVGSGATSGETLDIEITNPSTEVTVAAGLVSPATPVAISGTTTLGEAAPTAGDGNLLKRSPEETCHGCHKTDRNRTVSDPDWGEAIKTHNSDLIGSSKWSGSGGWGVLSGKYGEFGCTTCHTPHYTKNIYLINEIINTPDGSNWNTTGLTTVDVIFNGMTNMGDDSDSHTTSKRVCEVCHSITSYHRYNATTQSTANRNHNNASDCTQCHNHRKAFKGEGSCTDCHTGVASGANGYVSRDIMGSDFIQASRHIYNGTATNWDCIVCHAEGDTTKASASPADVGLTGAHENAQVEMRNVDNPGNPGVSGTNYWVWDKNNMTDSMHSDMDSFCMSCHDSDLAISSGTGKGGASGIAVRTGDDGVTLSPSDAERFKPFNSSDDINGGLSLGGSITPGATLTTWFTNATSCGDKGFTWTGTNCIDTRSKVLDVKGQFYPGTGGTGTGYNGNPSQHAVRGGRYSTTHPGECNATANRSYDTQGECEGAGYTWTATSQCITTHTSQSTCEANSNFVWYQWSSAAWNSATTPKGKAQNISVTRETTTLHCADCHTSDGNAHGGTNNFMLVSSTIDAVCYTCHSSTVYTNVTGQKVSRLDHGADSHAWDSGAESKFDASVCLNCHGGAHYDGYGAIHGIPSGEDLRKVLEGAGNRERYRFIGGSVMSFDPGSWTLGNGSESCYFIDPDPQPWSNCNHHGASQPATTQNSTPKYGRDTAY